MCNRAMLRIVVGTLLLGVGFAPLVSRAAETAGEMVSLCAPVAKAQRLPAGDVHFDTNFESGQCWGAFSAIQQLSRLKDDAALPPILGFCATEFTTRTDLLKQFIAFVERHPEKRSEPFGLVVLEAMRSSFPCTSLLESTPAPTTQKPPHKS